jgi:hypothetical protein
VEGSTGRARSERPGDCHGASRTGRTVARDRPLEDRKGRRWEILGNGYRPESLTVNRVGKSDKFARFWRKGIEYEFDF